MATPVRDKYYLRTLHEEIGLFDRKLAHLLKYEAFASDKERDAAVNKMTAKREQLVKAARLMTEQGIEFKSSEIPRSLRPEGAAEEEAAAPATDAAAPDAAPAAVATDRPGSGSHDGISMDFRNEIKEYMAKRRKTMLVSPKA